MQSLLLQPRFLPGLSICQFSMDDETRNINRATWTKNLAFNILEIRGLLVFIFNFFPVLIFDIPTKVAPHKNYLLHRKFLTEKGYKSTGLPIPHSVMRRKLKVTIWQQLEPDMLDAPLC